MTAEALDRFAVDADARSIHSELSPLSTIALCFFFISCIARSGLCSSKRAFDRLPNAKKENDHAPDLSFHRERSL